MIEGFKDCHFDTKLFWSLVQPLLQVYAYCPPLILPHHTQIRAHTRARKHILLHTYTQLKTKTDTTLCHPRSGTRTRCNTPQHTATNCNTTYCNTLQHTATHCNTLQHTATHCNTLQHTATHCKAHIWHHFVPPPSKSQKHQRERVIQNPRPSRYSSRAPFQHKYGGCACVFVACT